MPNYSELKKKLQPEELEEKPPVSLSEMNDKLFPPQEDVVPYDPEASELTNVGRFMLNNAASDDGMMNMAPVAGTVKSVAKLAAEEGPEVARSGLFKSIIEKLRPELQEAGKLGKGKIADEAVLQPALRDEVQKLAEQSMANVDHVGFASQKASRALRAEELAKANRKTKLAKLFGKK